MWLATYAGSLQGVWKSTRYLFPVIQSSPLSPSPSPENNDSNPTRIHWLTWVLRHWLFPFIFFFPFLSFASFLYFPPLRVCEQSPQCTGSESVCTINTVKMLLFTSKYRSISVPLQRAAFSTLSVGGSVLSVEMRTDSGAKCSKSATRLFSGGSGHACDAWISVVAVVEYAIRLNYPVWSGYIHCTPARLLLLLLLCTCIGGGLFHNAHLSYLTRKYPISRVNDPWRRA